MNTQTLRPGQHGPGWHFFIAEDVEEMSRQASEHLARALRLKPDSLLCAATGGTPTRTYELLAAQAAREPGLCGSLTLLKLDEWGGLPMDHPGTCETYVQQKLIKPLALPPERTISFESTAEPEAECKRIAGILAERGPIDLCVLGLGLNGHLALNEPADRLQPFSHRAELATSSLAHPMIRDSAVPVPYGLTLGMAEIFHSREIVLLVNGAHKAAPLKQLLSGEISTQFPASLLWLHPNVSCFCDRAAASEEVKTW